MEHSYIQKIAILGIYLNLGMNRKLGLYEKKIPIIDISTTSFFDGVYKTRLSIYRLHR